MRPIVRNVLLWLFVINLGVAFGAGLFEARILVPQWLTRAADSAPLWNGEAALQANTGLRFWVYVTTVPLTLLTLANLVVAWGSSPPRRRWWLAAGLLSLADRLFTFFYFIPTMLRLMRAGVSTAPEVVAQASQWAALDHVRHAILLAAWLAALKVLSMSGRNGG